MHDLKLTIKCKTHAHRLHLINTAAVKRQSTHNRQSNVFSGQFHGHHYAFSMLCQHSNTYQAVNRSYTPRYEPKKLYYQYHLLPNRELPARNRQIPKLLFHNPFPQNRENPLTTLFNGQVDQLILNLGLPFPNMHSITTNNPPRAEPDESSIIQRHQ